MRFSFLDFETRGSAETLHAILADLAPGSERMRRTLVLNCNTVYFSDVLRRFRALPTGEGASFYFADDGRNPEDAGKYSYITLSDDRRDTIVDIREKVAISRSANAGAYGFPSAALLRECIGELLDGLSHPSLGLNSQTSSSPPASPSTSGCSGTASGRGSAATALLVSMYVSTVIRHMMASRGVRFVGLKAPEVHNLGTPRALREFVRGVQVGALPGARPMRFCFDLDGTLLKSPELSSIVAAADKGDMSGCGGGSGGGGTNSSGNNDGDGLFSLAEPIECNVALVRQLRAAGHTIIIHTARRMGACGGNTGLAMAEIGHVTFEQLARFSIPYDEIVFGKPAADVYISASTIDSTVAAAMSKELGWELDKEHTNKNHDAAAAVAPRHTSTPCTQSTCRTSSRRGQST